MPKRLLLGIGNPFLKDDRAGLEVVYRARLRGCPWETQELYTVGFELLDKIKGYQEVFLIDAAQWGASPGTIIQLNGQKLRDPHLSTINTHSMTLGHTLEIGYRLFPKEMPLEIWAFLIQAGDIEHFAQELSPPVERAVEDVLKCLEGIWLGGDRVALQ